MYEEDKWEEDRDWDDDRDIDDDEGGPKEDE